VPGYLLTPFGWAAQPLATILQSEPGLLRHAFELDKPRMHLIALSLAHLEESWAPEFAPVMFCAPIREVLRRVVGRAPTGIKGVLRRLPFTVLSRQGYLRLIELLDDHGTAKLLHHLDAPKITDTTVRVLYEVPAALRPVLAGAVRFIDNLDHLPDGLQWLVSRGAAVNFDALIADLAAQAQPGQFVARLRNLVAALPLPQTLPPAQIEMARRIDAAADVCALGKRFKNCLANYARLIDAGECSIYMWDDPATPAVCQVTRHGRLGWCLSQALGPGNRELESKQLQAIRTAFADAGIPHQSAICALEAILQTDSGTRSHTRRRRQHDLERLVWRLEDTACQGFRTPLSG
jgi:hypothetical protein